MFSIFLRKAENSSKKIDFFFKLAKIYSQLRPLTGPAPPQQLVSMFLGKLHLHATTKTTKKIRKKIDENFNKKKCSSVWQ